AIPRRVLIDHMAEDDRIQKRKDLVDRREHEDQGDQKAVLFEVREEYFHFFKLIVFPSSQRRGGAKRRGGQFGDTFRQSSIEASPYRARASRHPVCAYGASSPPLRGGEYTPTPSGRVLPQTCARRPIAPPPIARSALARANNSHSRVPPHHIYLL